MTQDVDPRLARRRRQVQETLARRRLRWTIGLLSLAVVAGLIVAVFQSSWFSINSILVEGADRAEVLTILGESGVEEGVSIVSVRAGDVETALREDPWVAEAQVRVVWPQTVEVALVEYIPIARVTMGSTWLVSSGQGSVLAVGEDLVEPWVQIDAGELAPGGEIEDRMVLGALEFVAALPVELKEGLVVEADGQDLAATVAGYQIKLGSTRDMAQKAVTLATLLENDIAAGSIINLVSPLRPAVTNPEPLVEGSREVTSETTASS